MAFLWAYPLSKQFHEDLQARKPAALVLLAHYCVLLQAVDHKWYLNGMAWQLLEDIERNIHPGTKTGWSGPSGGYIGDEFLTTPIVPLGKS